ncbi:response regulator transcription factor [Tateyamaria omphalii]|uniref:HTH luxR-type domain-containing protein n=1 Tax=Tateyamaria omphalii TaxID=299262 RepID=A0A1P8MVH1_9RHOB|nr:response regulator transcription factor [Tateyamaria omphalii]APX11993.1 hypothetical protein BWR18_10115 [Tateyamaria omphalii]
MRILIYSKTRLFAECLAAGLARHVAVDQALSATDAVSFQTKLAQDRPCAAILDLSNAEAWDDARAAKALYHDIVLLGLSVSDSPQDIVRCAKVGCLGVIPYDSSVERTVTFVRRALRGELSCSPSAAAELARALCDSTSQNATQMPRCLTRREGEVCSLVCEGLTNKEIARELNCSEGTIKNHMHSILSKLNISRRSAVAQHIRQQPSPSALLPGMLPHS